MQLPGIALLGMMKIVVSLVPDLPRLLLGSTDRDIDSCVGRLPIGATGRLIVETGRAPTE